MLSCGQNTPLALYEPKSPQEQAIKTVLLDLQEATNTKNHRKIENLIHERASLMIGRDRKILSKTAYVEILPKRLAGCHDQWGQWDRSSISHHQQQILFPMDTH